MLLPLVGDWSLRKLVLSGRPEWALQYKGMDWIQISEFLEVGVPMLDDEMRKFSSDVCAAVEEDRAYSMKLEEIILDALDDYVALKMMVPWCERARAAVRNKRRR